MAANDNLPNSKEGRIERLNDRLAVIRRGLAAKAFRENLSEGKSTQYV
jgi:hypothetical protein